MDWLSFLIGALVGWLISWLIDYLFCRRRRIAAEALLRGELERCNQECAALREQRSGYEDLQARLEAANAEIAALQAQLDGMKGLQVRLEDADKQVLTLQAELDSMKGLQAQLNGANAEIDRLKAQLAGVKGLQADLVSWKARATEQSLELERLTAELAALASAGAGAAAMAAEPGPAPTTLTAEPVEAEPLAEQPAEVEVVTPAAVVQPPEVELVTPAAAPPLEPDDLTRIEGIGPKINALLNEDGIYTFAQLAAASVEHLQAILTAAGRRYRLADPQTWPEQAALARDGKWDALQALQQTLKAGRAV